jgi:hypothetical protein
MKTNQENMKAGQEETMAAVEAGLEGLKATDLEANPEEIEAVMAHREVPMKRP